MLKHESKDVESIRRKWNKQAKRYDDWYKTFKGAVEHSVDWELLKGHLPSNRDAKILDAAGGTGRMTLPLAKMGYSVTLCDISPRMLDVARQKMFRQGVLDKVKILQCDVRRLRFADESFDFVLCWDGMVEAVRELIRVTKKGGRLSLFLVSKYGTAIREFHEDPDSALALLRPEPGYAYDDKEKRIAVSREEAIEFLKKEGIKVNETYAVCGILELLSIPEKVQGSRKWDEKFFRQVTEMLLRLSKEPSVKGLSRHLVLYGERT